MLTTFISRLQRKPEPLVSVVLFFACTGLMGWLRLYAFRDMVINLTYGLPLLVCLWYPDRRLLWSMAGTFMAMSAYKTFGHTPELTGPKFGLWLMQVVNIVMIGGVVHLVINLVQKLREQKFQLEATNQELMAREEEISRQNEELQSQAEELAQQNEEIQQQSEEVQQQAEELQAQAEELHLANGELGKRQAVLQALLDSLHTDADVRDLPERICHLLISLMGDAAVAAVVLEKEGDDLVVLAHAGPASLATSRWRFDRSFAAVIMTQNRTAFVADLHDRPDLVGAQSAEREFRSVLGTPLRLGGRPAGVVKVFSDEPHAWTKEQFKIVEWVSAQCSLTMDSRRLQTELQRSNSDLDRLVRDRTAELQELVNELEHFSYTITHDLRAPLRAMHGFAGLLAEECLPVLNDQSREYLQRIATAAGRMDRLITDALSYSKVVRTEMPMAAMDVGRLLKGIIESYPIFQPPRAEIEIDETLPLVVANEAGLTQCFSNLLGNAVKFVAPGQVPRIRIRGERRGDRVRVWCEDNGIGIPADMQSRVFIMFQRLSKDYEGTGIGLALVKKVTERMGGSVGLESEAGQGSRFWIELKAAELAIA